MSLLKRIESARPGAAPGAPTGPAGGAPGAPTPQSGVAGQRLMSQQPVRESLREVKFRIQTRVIQDLDPKLDLANQVEVRRQIEEIFSRVIDEEGLALTRAERIRMLEQITDEIIGLGPLEPLLRDETVTEIMVNGPRQVYIERSRQARADERRLPERRPRDAHHRSDHRPDRPAHRRVEPDGRRPAHGRIARQRDHPAAVADRPGHHHSKVRGVAVHRRRPGPFRHRHAGDVRLPARMRGSSTQHLRVRRNRLGQDDHAERALVVHSQRRANRHHRGRGRAPAPAGARRDARVPPAQHRGPRRGARSASSSATPCE